MPKLQKREGKDTLFSLLMEREYNQGFDLYYLCYQAGDASDRGLRPAGFLQSALSGAFLAGVLAELVYYV